jgi:hypothetical protein
MMTMILNLKDQNIKTSPAPYTKIFTYNCPLRATIVLVKKKFIAYFMFAFSIEGRLRTPTK